MAKEGANGVYDNLALDIQEETAVFVKVSSLLIFMVLKHFKTNALNVNRAQQCSLQLVTVYIYIGVTVGMR